MKLSYNISFSMAAMIITIVLILIMSLKYSSSNIVNKRFKFFLISIIVMIALDIITVITNDYAAYIPVWGNMILNNIYFFACTVVGLLFFYYIVSVALKDTKPETRRIFYLVNLIALGIFTITLVVNQFTGIYFYFENGQYMPDGPAYLFINLLSVLYVLEAVVIFVIKRKNFRINQIVSTALFVVIFFASFILQLFVFKKTLLSDFGTATGTLIVFFTIETPDYVKLMQTLNELNDLKASLENQVINRTKELNEERKAYEKLTLETLSSLAEVVDAKDHYTNGHSFRVAAYAKGMAKILGYSKTDAEQLYFAGLIHDVGKIGVPLAIINKPGKLTPEEYATIQSHTTIGGDILKGMHEFEIFKDVARYHHERYDGNGYPDKLRGDNIPYPARIVAICDTFDAMTSDRSYRKALPDQTALNELLNNKGTQFDPILVDAFIELYSMFPDTIKNHIEDLIK